MDLIRHRDELSSILKRAVATLAPLTEQVLLPNRSESRVNQNLAPRAVLFRLATGPTFRQDYPEVFCDH